MLLLPEQSLPTRRLAIAVIGLGVKGNRYPLFRKLRPHGVFYPNVDPENGLKAILKAVTERSAAFPIPFAHWYIDGGRNEIGSSKALACISFNSLEPVRASLVQKMRRSLQSLGGPEAVRTDTGSNASGRPRSVKRG